MATILKGKNKGLEVRIIQFCNNWFHIGHEQISNQNSIMNPTSLEFTDEEKKRISDTPSGVLFNRYEWNGNKLKKIRR